MFDACEGVGFFFDEFVIVLNVGEALVEREESLVVIFVVLESLYYM